MDFNDLLKKMVELDQPIHEARKPISTRAKNNHNDWMAAKYNDDYSIEPTEFDIGDDEFNPDYDSFSPDLDSLPDDYTRDGSHSYLQSKERPGQHWDEPDASEFDDPTEWEWPSGEEDQDSFDRASIGNKKAWEKRRANTKFKELHESELLECPCEEGPTQSKQQDSVNMNVSINGQGANGIRDLMDILRNIEKVDDTGDHQDILVGEPDHGEPDHDDEVVFDIEPSQDDDEEEDEPLMTDDYENSVIGASDAAIYGISAMIGTGDDLASKGSKKALKVNGGENPISETLIRDLHKLYQDIKQR